jgi:uncharacterized protein YndB with AHSA1/START domain
MTPPLVVSREIAASPAAVFAAWTEPDKLLLWWGPKGVSCVHAELDARQGGQYRLDNRLPTGVVIVIRGEFLEWQAPHRLVYTWWVEPSAQQGAERVTVQFEASPVGTKVTVHHQRITDDSARQSHELGWIGCFDRLGELFAGRASPGVARD